MSGLRVTIGTYLFFWGVLLSSSAYGEKLNLDQAYQKALGQSESLQSREQQVKAAEERYKQALATLYPNVHVRGTQRIRNDDSFGIQGGRDTENEGGFRTSLNRKHPFESAINVRQPIFTGFREILFSEAREAEMRALGLEATRAREVLYLNVAELFLQSIYYNHDLDLVSRAEKVLRERVTDLQEFVKLGKSRESEILAADSDIVNLLAAREQVKGLLAISKELLAFLVGLPAEELELVDSSMTPGPQSLEYYLALGENRNDVKARKERVVASQKNLKIAERNAWPILNLEGNYYPYEDPDLNREWELLFSLDIPIFEGGALAAREREQQALLRDQELQLQQIERETARDIRASYKELQSAQEEVRTLKVFADTTKKNYAAQREDYKNGVVTNLEVLRAIEQGVDAERRLIDARTKERLAIAKLLVASGDVK